MQTFGRYFNNATTCFSALNIQIAEKTKRHWFAEFMQWGEKTYSRLHSLDSRNVTHIWLVNVK